MINVDSFVISADNIEDRGLCSDDGNSNYCAHLSNNRKNVFSVGI